MSSGLLAKFASVGSATMASRVLGFAREALVAATLGTGPVADVFYTCFRFPNLFRRLFAEGAFNIAFVPLFSKELEGEGEDAARIFAQQVFAVLASWLLVITGLALVFMPFLVSTLVAPGFVDSPDKFELTVTMTRIMFPYLFCMSLVAMLSGILNALRRYFLAAAVPVLLNVVLVSILGYALLVGLDARAIGLAMAWGVFVSGFAQLAALAMAVKREGMGFSLIPPKLTEPVKRLLVLMGPGLLTGGVLQINLLIGTIIATAQDGANALLNFADRINQLPLGVIGIAVGVVLLPELSRALQAKDQKRVEDLQNRSLEFVLALTLPAAIGLALLPNEIVGVLYERGAFDSFDRQQTALALAAFASGLPAYVMLKVFQPAFFAREDMRTPFWFSVVMVISNIILSLSLFPVLGHVAIAIATSISAWINLVLLVGTLWHRGQFRPDTATAKRIVLLLVASGAMVPAILVCQNYWGGWLLGDLTYLRVLSLMATIAIAMAVYFGLALTFGGIDRNQLKTAFRRSS